MQKHIILIGNPGKGKSTLLNAMIGKVIFRSGFSAGTGLSRGLEKHVCNGQVFFDTPGLDDPEKREDAAKAIEAALKQDGIYCIFFVVTLEAGRVNTKDAATMKAVLKACPTIRDRYGLIINKVTPKLMPKVLESLGKITSVLYYDDSIPSTGYIYVNANDKNLEDEDDKLTKLSAEFLGFLDKAPQIVIAPSEVSALDVRDWEKQAEQMEKAMQAMSQDNEKLQARMLTLAREHKKQMSELAQKNEKQIQDLKASNEKEIKDLKRKLNPRMVAYHHWDGQVHRYEGFNDSDTGARFGSIRPEASKILVNKDTKSIVKKDGPENDYMKMCAGCAIDRGELAIPGGHHVVWHWEDGAQHQSFSCKTAAAIRFGKIDGGASRLLILNGRIEKNEGPSNEWKQSAKGALLIN